MFSNLKADFKRYGKFTPYLLFEQGIWATIVFRFGSWVHTFKVPILSLVLKAFAFFLSKIIEITTGISIPASVKIGKGFYIGHFGGIIVNPHAVIGENFSISPGVIIGTRALGRTGAARIGDNVYVGVGAKILGDITIGNNVRIGANSVVIKDVPDDATVVGIPGYIIKKV